MSKIFQVDVTFKPDDNERKFRVKSAVVFADNTAEAIAFAHKELAQPTSRNIASIYAEEDDSGDRVFTLGRTCLRDAGEVSWHDTYRAKCKGTMWRPEDTLLAMQTEAMKQRADAQSVTYTSVLETLAAHESFCLNNEEERKDVAQEVINALCKRNIL